MNIIKRYTVKSILNFGIIFSIVLTLILCSVDLFTHLDSYTTNGVTTSEALKLTLMYAPEALMISIGFAFMLSVLYFLANLHSSNEIICILNSGISFIKVLKPIIITSFFIAVFSFGFNELVAIRTKALRDVKLRNISSIHDSYDSQNIALADIENSYMIYALNYIDSKQTLTGVTLISTDSGSVIRTDAQSAVWDNDKGYWIFYDVFEYIPLSDGSDTIINNYPVLNMKNVVIEPEMFRNVSNEISTMELETAFKYVNRMKNLNPEQYASMATDLYERLFTCLTPFVLMLISCSMNYRFKKNAFFIVLLVAIGLAVVYFVVRMVTLLMAEQGVIQPYMGSLFPLFVIIFLSFVFSLSTRK